MIEKMKISNLFQTSGLPLAFALTLSFPVFAVDKTNPYKALFQFKRDEDLERLVGRYWRGELTVEPQAYYNAIRAVRSRIYDNVE